MTCPSEAKRHLEQALGNDPKAAVIGVRRLRQEDLPWLEERAVRMARNDGFTWAQLGRLLGKSRQAIRQAFGRIDGTSQRLAKRPMSNDESFMASWSEVKADARRRREFDDLAGGEPAVPC